MAKEKQIKIFYNSWIAKLLLLFSTCSTIMLFGAVFSKKAVLSDEEKAHESIHVVQYLECFILGTLLLFVLLYLGASIWFILLPIICYYILYLMEWLVSFIHHLFSKRKKDFVKANGKAYWSSAMEMEAYDNQNNPLYLKTRKFLAFVRYYGKI